LIHYPVSRAGTVPRSEGLIMFRRRGFSMVEVLLALFIIAIVVGLLLPWLTHHRENGSGRSKSLNNLKLIILACHNYNDAYQGKLPPLLDVGECAPNGAGLNSLFFNILPYIEYYGIYRMLDKATPSTYYKRGTGAAQEVVRTYISPNDATVPDGAITSVTVSLPEAPLPPFAQSFVGWYATTSYAANGMIPWNTGGLPRSFVDGTSNTIMFAERPQVCTDAAGTTVYNLWGYGSYGPSTPAIALLTPDDPEGFPSTGQIVAALPLPAAWSAGIMPVQIGTVDAPVQPSPVPRSFQVGLRRNGPCDPRIAGSPHAGGMLVALADGSVRSLDPKMSDWTYWAAMTPDGKESQHTDW
jgi:prepilin-type N-terminal cleavage/methylation domain-containing protein